MRLFRIVFEGNPLATPFSFLLVAKAFLCLHNERGANAFQDRIE